MTEGQTQEVTTTPELTNSFEVNISQEKIGELKEEKDPEKRQALLDGIFTPERRAKLLATASEDSKGRKVRYFRKMPYDKMINLLETGEQTRLSYFDDIHGAVDKDYLRFLLSDYARDNDSEYEILSKNNIEDDIRNTLGKTIPSPELDKVIDNLTYDNLLPLLDKYIPDSFIKRRHTGSLAQIFSPYLSMSVGGIINLSSRSYVELVMPDEEVTVNEHGVEGEKEVFARKIKRENIARVFTSENTLYQDEAVNPDTIVGQYAQKVGNGIEAIDSWRWEEQTADCLPQALRSSMVTDTLITRYKTTNVLSGQ